MAQDPFARKTLDEQIAAAQKHLEELMLDKQMAETQARLDALLEQRNALAKQKLPHSITYK